MGEGGQSTHHVLTRWQSLSTRSARVEVFTEHLLEELQRLLGEPVRAASDSGSVAETGSFSPPSTKKTVSLCVISTQAADQTPFGILSDTMWFRFAVEGCSGDIQLGLHARTALALVDLLMGCSADEHRSIRPLTPWEQGCLSYLLLRVMDVWTQVGGPHLSHVPQVRTSLQAPLPGSMRPFGVVLNLVLELEVGVTFPVQLAIPASTWSRVLGDSVGADSWVCSALGYCCDLDGTLLEQYVLCPIELPIEQLTRISEGDVVFPTSAMAVAHGCGESVASAALFVTSPNLNGMAGRLCERRGVYVLEDIVDLFAPTGSHTGPTTHLFVEVGRRHVRPEFSVFSTGGMDASALDSFTDSGGWVSETLRFSTHAGSDGEGAHVGHEPRLIRGDGAMLAVLSPLVVMNRRGFRVMGLSVTELGGVSDEGKESE